MPVNHAIWTVEKEPACLVSSRLPSEQLLEDMIINNPGILSDEWLLIGQQVITNNRGRVDLLAIAPDGSLVLIELKRNRTPRDVVAQALDYASWVEQLTNQEIIQIFEIFSGGENLGACYKARFGVDLEEEALNHTHQIILVAAELDDSTERIVTYLGGHGLAINVVYFQVFEHKDEQLLSRAWLIDPEQTQSSVANSPPRQGKREPWNGEFYVSYGPTTTRSWEDARKYGFIDGSGGAWYTRTLKLLSEGDRIWVKIPKTGYVGVGIVAGEAVDISDFELTSDQGEPLKLDVLEFADLYRETAQKPGNSVQFIPIQWLDTVSESEALNEVGLFGNQNTVCQPTTPKWRHTIDRLKKHFPHHSENSQKSE